ncbi:hypothetical protein MASR1M45_10770 [Candidatus Kapaibacterium sp.]
MKLKKIINLSSFLLLFLIISSCSSVIRFGSSDDRADTNNEIDTQGSVFYGKASYYGNEFHGRKTANGEIYDKIKFLQLTSHHIWNNAEGQKFTQVSIMKLLESMTEVT